MKSKFLFTIFLLLIFSCTNNQVDSSIDPGTTEIIQTKESKSTEENTSGNNDFQKFWNEFRLAVIKNDVDKVKSVTIFPFETRGEMDSDALVKYNKKEFNKLLRAYLLQEAYWLNEERSITHYEEIKRTIKPSESQVQENEVRIGNLVFELKDGDWKLVFAYLNIRDEDFWKR